MREKKWRFNLVDSLLQIINSIDGLLKLHGASDGQIIEAEKALGLKFSTEYKLYLKEFGCISFASHELMGLNASKRLSVVDVTNFERKCKKQLLPSNAYVLEIVNDGDSIIIQNESGEVFEVYDAGECRKGFESFADYVKSLI